MTWQAVHGVEQAKKDAANFTAAAMDALVPLGEKGKPLQELAQHLLQRRT